MLVVARSVSFRSLTPFSETDTCPDSFDFRKEENSTLPRLLKQEGGKDLKSKPLIRCRHFEWIPADFAICVDVGCEFAAADTVLYGFLLGTVFIFCSRDLRFATNTRNRNYQSRCFDST